MINSYYVVYDCETGGLDCFENPITQFACVILDPHTLNEVDRWETYIKPYADLKVTSEALERNMCTMADIKRGMDVYDFVITLEKILKNYNKEKKKAKGRLIAVGHNIDAFDTDFMNVAFNLFEKDWNSLVFETSIDTLPLSKLTWGVSGNEIMKLPICCERAKINLTDAHGAMNDVLANADLLRYFMKKLRSKKGDSFVNSSEKRKEGKNFYQFKCS